MIRTKFVGLATAAVLTTGVAMLPVPAANAAPGTNAATNAGSSAQSAAVPSATTLPVTGTLADGTAFTGELSNLSTRVVDGVLMLSGTITGTGLPAGGTTFSTPVQGLDTSGACTILTLDLGPLHLDLLGLVVDLAPVNLDITAVPGNGNLLGNLLCAVAGLLDNNGPLQGISALLNRLLTGLGL